MEVIEKLSAFVATEFCELARNGSQWMEIVTAVMMLLEVYELVVAHDTSLSLVDLVYVAFPSHSLVSYDHFRNFG